ncbi:MAG: AAA family ATPase [Candidatus Hydrogenedentes bacterium]|nr:AAA family ATPase [Candidatus Hydrogenedentota bacterium]
MSKPFIKRLKISNFKSIDTLELHDVGPFSVFAGANGTGKSNFFDALAFFQRVVVSGAVEAIRSSGGSEFVRNATALKSSDETNFGIELDGVLLDSSEAQAGVFVPTSYSMTIHGGESGPQLEEGLTQSGKTYNRPRGKSGLEYTTITGHPISPRIRDDYSNLSMFEGIAVGELARNIRLYRIDPGAATGAFEPDGDDTFLDVSGRNLAAVLSRMGKDPNVREDIREWMEFLVPTVESVNIERRHLDQRSEITFKEKHAARAFPAGFVSQGTMFALSLLVAILDKPAPLSLTLIEEPERGLHPKAIGELIELMRETATPEHAIWITTHSESVVRHTKLEELWLVDRKEGATIMKHASDGNLTDEDIRPFGMDEAWLSNLLGAGLPW